MWTRVCRGLRMPGGDQAAPAGVSVEGVASDAGASLVAFAMRARMSPATNGGARCWLTVLAARWRGSRCCVELAASRR